MSEIKLNYRFHNPNTDTETANYILKILIEANATKVEQTVQQLSVQQTIPSENDLSLK